MIKLKHCSKCKKNKLHVGSYVNNTFHFALTIVTFGVWGIAWILLLLDRRWFCRECNGLQT